jgi:hypothetical protein
VINIKSGEPYDTYIAGRVKRGRFNLECSPWHNPFNKAFRAGLITRQESCEQYLIHVLTSPDLMARLPELMDKTLACFCKPKLCHGDVLVRLVELFEVRRETVWKFGIGPESGPRERPRGVEEVPIRAPLAAREAR